jgi:hypothetical protein
MTKDRNGRGPKWTHTIETSGPRSFAIPITMEARTFKEPEYKDPYHICVPTGRHLPELDRLTGRILERVTGRILDRLAGRILDRLTGRMEAWQQRIPPSHRGLEA